MSETNDIERLLRQNAERQLADFDRDRQRRAVMDRLADAHTRNTGWRIPRRIAAVVIFMLVLGYAGVSLFHVTGRPAAKPVDTVAGEESVESDRLLASTDPATILLTGPARLLACNDPTLAPHSPWDQ